MGTVVARPNGATDMPWAGKWVGIKHQPDALGYPRKPLCSVQYNDDGIPIVLEVRCRERECCPRSDNGYYVHLVTLHGIQNNKPVGQYVTEFREYGNIASLPLGARVVRGAAGT